MSLATYLEQAQNLGNSFSHGAQPRLEIVAVHQNDRLDVDFDVVAVADLDGVGEIAAGAAKLVGEEAALVGEDCLADLHGDPEAVPADHREPDVAAGGAQGGLVEEPGDSILRFAALLVGEFVLLRHHVEESLSVRVRVSMGLSLSLSLTRAS